MRNLFFEKKWQRARTIMVSALVVALLCAAYVGADALGLISGPLATLKTVSREGSVAAMNPRYSLQRMQGQTVGDVKAQAIDENQAQALVDQLVSSVGDGNTVGVVVADTSGNTVAAHNASQKLEPASTLKTLTAFAASVTFDAAETLNTTVQLSRNEADASTGTLTLVGGGDILLGTGTNDNAHVNGRAGLASLADRAVEALQSRGITHVQLQYDNSLFNNDSLPSSLNSTSSVNEGYINEIETTAMAIDEARAWGTGAPSNPDSEGDFSPQRSAYPAWDVTSAFAEALSSRGIAVDNSDYSNAKADSSAFEIASVQSAPMWQIIQLMLTNSDNSLAQLLGRLLAIRTGKDNSFAGATSAVSSIVSDHGIQTDNMVLADTSGLAPGNALTADTLVSVQAALLDTTHSIVGNSTWAAATGMPISQYSGTLIARDFTAEGRGLVRAKTGTLEKVTSLTGNVSRANGGALIFSVIVNGENLDQAISAVNTFVGKLVDL
ncbi:D-alanyl-D-alanine carboxypeptidase/D-alanyl-D-alanine endopeptidase [Alloscardovia criceti]|uniref:D-alanyl-D-alanine carboxypeptidase/D-alanyl-D-alanine endopeptidase n=1 Tax=Alloscardovia criceti TaxID=356828 RepID=UPI0003682A9A|nr:D-alanyl-D-alanine carboxypeptidase/D-alanyl-D-alanine-endopeptidase [Alloscardovia criceti]